jgi:alpha,alpha-trehalase
MQGYKPLEQYGIIGNLETCALVGADGSIDWYCYPLLDSPSVFAALLDCKRGGSFSITPAGSFRSLQHYKYETNTLVTSFETEQGTVELTDFMPLQVRHGVRRHESLEIVRRAKCTQGTVSLIVAASPRFDYGRVLPDLERDLSGIAFRGAGQVIGLGSNIPLAPQGHDATARIALMEGEFATFALYRGAPGVIPRDLFRTIQQETEDYWKGWVHTCNRAVCAFDGLWHDAVVRSGLVLKLLTHPVTGAIAAAPTTSIPESIGGVRNWDYRYAWVRDASFTVQALHNLGHVKEAHDFFRWIRSIARRANDPSKLHIMYGLDGDTALTEQTLDHLSGYRDSRPVRIGNGAHLQRQLDIFGELILALYDTSRYGLDLTASEWDLVSTIAEYVSEEWKHTDSGIWEVRGGDRHFTYSKLMCWVAVDRAIRIAGRLNHLASVERWKTARKDIRSAILKHGYNEKKKSFVQSFDSDVLDATSLLVASTGFLPHDDVRVQSTINATLNELTVGSKVFRYKSDDGLPGEEGAFLLCSFWLISALALTGRLREAEEYFVDILKHSGPTQLFSEEIDIKSGKQLGNFPQAFSHIGLINSALYIGSKSGKTHSGPQLHGLQRLDE